MEKLQLGVLASGRGSNFEAILKNVQQKKLDASIQVVISNKASAGALEIARENNIPAVHISKKKFPEQAAFDEQLLSVLKSHQVNFVVLAGYLTPPASGVGERKASYGVATGRLDPYVANLLAQETPEVQRAVIGILTMLKNIAKGLDKTEEA